MLIIIVNSLSELTIDDLKTEMKLTDEQLNTAIMEPDLPEVSACFDNTDDYYYLEKLELSLGQKTDVSEVKAKTRLNRTQRNEACPRILAEQEPTTSHLPSSATYLTLPVQRRRCCSSVQVLV